MARPADWKAPWGDAEIPDSDALQELIWKGEEEAKKLKADLEKTEEVMTAAETKAAADAAAAATAESRKGETALDAIKRELEGVKTELGKSKLAAEASVRLEVALEKGLTAKQAARLVGGTKAELGADADAYLAEHAPENADTTEPTVRRIPRARQNPLADHEDDGPLDVRKAVDSFDRSPF